ncbi:hypothetical protein QTO34_012299 [Cnephaeus nilssonii]|uniref:Uncharacterized protein n=1 Tax=Cnephaeus nilssonii TaxID=3371016 RepID=A0AA40LE69_CNENI|nr:hypothetical protein QTO34_012299 [Eptesicus nilssonii]
MGRKVRLSPLAHVQGQRGARPGPGRAQAEALAFQASLREEHMRVQELEKAVEQKVGAGLRPGSGRDVPLWPGATWAPAATSEPWEMQGLTFLFQKQENDELIRICDDLISVMEKT